MQTEYTDQVPLIQVYIVCQMMLRNNTSLNSVSVFSSSQKHMYIILTPLNPTFI